MTTPFFKIPRIILPFLLALAATVSHAQDAQPAAPDGPAAIERYKTYTAEGISITYPSDEQELVDEIINAYRFPIRLVDDEAFEAQLARWKKTDLGLVAKKLALEKPTGPMLAVFDQFRTMCQPIVTQEIRVIRIYHSADIKEAHARKLPVEGINYIPQSDSVSIANHIVADGPGGAKVRVMPLVLMQKAPGMAVEKMRLFNGTLRDMRWRLDEAIYNNYCGRLYEIVKPEIIACISNSRAPIWFADGLMNGIPLVVMRSHNPGLSFDQILKTYGTPPPDFEKYAVDMNLETWVITRTAATTKPENDSYFYLSMLVALDAIQQHGDGWLPEFFTRLRAENSTSLNMGVVYSIFTELTNADLHDSVTRTKERLADQLAQKK